MPDEINSSSGLTPLGRYNFRNQQKKFGIKMNDRRRHIYVVGKTGVGKTTLLKNMMIADIQAGRGVGVLDPHGEFAESLLDYIPEERVNDVIYFDPSDLAHPIAFNPMEQVTTEFRHLVASGIMSVFKKIWVDAWSARMEYILNNTLLALLELPDTTLMDVMRMFADKEFRKKVVESLEDPVIKAFWRDEFANYGQRLESEALASIQNKVGQLVSNPLIRNIMGQPRSTLNMREIMDSGKILIVNLSKGKIGEDNSALLGAMIITRLQLAAMSRVDIKNEDERRDFFLYVDEFQNFATDSFASILSEARKYRLSLVLAHQYIGQLMTSESTSVRDAIFGNVGTIICFRVGAADAEFLEKEFMPQFTQTDLVNLAFASIYIRLMIDGLASQPFSAETLGPIAPLLISHRDVIIANSREHYSTPRAVVEKKISGSWQGQGGTGIAEKIERRDERRLSDVLRPGAPSAPVRRSAPPSQIPRAVPLTEAAVTDDPMLQAFLKTRGEKPVRSERPEAVDKGKTFTRPNVDIGELRRSINQSLNKPGEEKTKESVPPVSGNMNSPTKQSDIPVPPDSKDVPSATHSRSIQITINNSGNQPQRGSDSSVESGKLPVPEKADGVENQKSTIEVPRETVREVHASVDAPVSSIVEANTTSEEAEPAAFARPPVLPQGGKDQRAKPKEFFRPTVSIDDLRNSVRQSLKKQTVGKSTPAELKEARAEDRGRGEAVVLNADKADVSLMKVKREHTSHVPSGKPIHLPEKADVPHTHKTI